MSLTEIRVLPWLNREEWLSVYQELFSDDTVAQRHAVDRIAVWKSRLEKALPTGVECTWQLKSAQFEDENAEHAEKLDNNDQKLRLTYSMAVIRFVNHITEQEKKGQYVQALHNLADDIGLPQWLVEMRHDASHGVLPSLHMLRIAARTSLSWIKEQYWDREAQEPETPKKKTPKKKQKQKTKSKTPEQREEKFSNLLVTFLQGQYKVVTGSKRNPNLSLLHQLRTTLTHHKHESIRVLLEDGYLIPNEEQLAALNIDEKELLSAGDLSLPEPFLIMWQPVIQVLEEAGLLGALVVSLADQLTGDGGLRDRVCAGWLMALLNASVDAESGDHTSSLSGSLDSSYLLKKVLLAPNIYTPALFKCLTSCLPVSLSEAQVSQIRGLLAAACPATDPDAADNTVSEPHTLERLMALVPDKLRSRLDGVKTRPAKLTRCPDPVDWSQYPLGTCPGAPLTYTSLELDPSLDKVMGSRSLGRSHDHPSRSLEASRSPETTSVSESAGLGLLNAEYEYLAEIGQKPKKAKFTLPSDSEMIELF